MRPTFRFLLMISFLPILGCAVGPKTQTDYVLIEPGVPVRVLENRRLKCRTLASEKVDGAPLSATVNQDVGGWVAMPEKHWDVIEKKLKEAKVVEDLP